MAIFLNEYQKSVLACFTVVGPLIWYEKHQVRLWIIFIINTDHFLQLGRSQMGKILVFHNRTRNAVWGKHQCARFHSQKWYY